MKTKKISFIDQNAAARFHQRLETLVRDLAPIGDFISQAPYYLSDEVRAQFPSFQALIQSLAMMRSEFFLSYDDNGKLLGVQILSEIHPSLKANYHAFGPSFHTSPKLCFKAFQDVIEYAFSNLGLVKLKAEISAPNLPAVRLFEAIGGKVVGVLSNDCLHNGYLTDNLILEAYNPAFLAQQPVDSEPDDDYELLSTEDDVDGEERIADGPNEPGEPLRPDSGGGVEQQLPKPDLFLTTVRQLADRAGYEPAKRAVDFGRFDS